MSPRGQVQRETNKRKRASFAAEHQIGFGESVFGYGVGERDDFKRHLLFGRPDRPFTLPSTSGLCYTRVRSGGMISRGGGNCRHLKAGTTPLVSCRERAMPNRKTTPERRLQAAKVEIDLETLIAMGITAVVTRPPKGWKKPRSRAKVANKVE